MAATARNLRSRWLRKKRRRIAKKKNFELARKLLRWEDLSESGEG